jgi:flagellar hook-basal body complex protein FliE
MTVNTLAAVNAYRNQLKLQSDIGDAASQNDVGKPTFSDLVKNGLQGAVDTQYQTEALKMDALTGKVDLSDLVTAVSNAELTLNTVVAVRDRVISAYQDIIRMPM